jgi:hypothetical protein
VIASKSVRGLAICLALALPRAAGADCQPAAVAQGDPALVSDLASRLVASGIATTAAPGCPAVTVQLEQHGPQLHLRLADGYQRTSERDVDDVATAAAVVESWTMDEVEAGTLPASPPPVPRERYRGLWLAATSGLASDATTWLGAALLACTRVGPLCAGVSLRAEADTTTTGGTSTLAQDSYALAAYATADLPRVWGAYVVSPGVGVGYGYLHVTAHHHDAMNNPLDLVTPDHELRLAAHVSVLRPIAAHWAVVGDLWGDGAALRSESTLGPAAALRLSLGIRIEAP